MEPKIEEALAESTQRGYARLAGSLLLGLSVIALAGSLVTSGVSLAIQLLVPMGVALVAFSLYATLKPVNRLLAQLAMIFYLEDSVLGWVVWMCSFTRSQLSTSSGSVAAGTVPAQALVDLTRRVASAAENAGGICFGVALVLFFYLFFTSRYIPRILSALGLAAAVIWTGLYVANVVFPEQHSVFQRISWPLMAAAVLTTGFWLMLFAVKRTSATS